MSILFCNLVRCLIDIRTEGIVAHDLVAAGMALGPIYIFALSPFFYC